MKLSLPRTAQIVEGLTYDAAPDAFARHFSQAFDAVRGQILKLERLQVYREPGKPYDQAIAEGNLQKARTFIPRIIADNQPGYDMLKQKHVEFIRCRPIKIPATDYTRWEIAVFRETAKVYEKIYWCLYTQLDIVFEEYATHDFMIFDARMALVQDYDASGQLRGGWYVDDPDKVLQLITLFGYIKANCMALPLLESPKIEID